MKAFLIILVASSVMFNVLHNSDGQTLGKVDFFEVHGPLFLIFITFLPRLTLLFSSVASGGIFWWIGLIFCPRVLVAALATVYYYPTNPLLVAGSWVVAIAGETMEKKGINKKKFVFRTFNMGGMNQNHRGFPGSSEGRVAQTIKKDGAIEAEFTKK